jgi:hypothetical protein
MELLMERKTGLTAEDVWAMFAETDRRMQESREKEREEREKERDERKKWREEWDKGIQEIRDIQKENAKEIKELSKNIGGVSNSNGSVAEEYFINSLKRKMEFAGIRFNAIEANRISKHKMKTPDIKEETRINEFDIVMLNGNCVAIIEIKYKAKIEDIEHLVNSKLEDFKISHPQYKDFNVYLGLGSFSFNDKTVDKARELGVGLLRQIGETVEYETGWVRAY